MKTAAIHFYTGTGNLRHAAEVAARELSAADYAVTVTHIMRDTVPPQGSFDLHLFIYPVYGLTYPEGVRRYVALLPDGRGTRAATQVPGWSPLVLRRDFASFSHRWVSLNPRYFPCANRTICSRSLTF